MTRLRKSFTALLAAAAFMLPAALAADETDYEKWLKDEVHLLISKKEEKEFKALSTNAERDKFIALFWARRDPTPQTEQNEFRDEYLRRLEYADRMFTHAGIKGSKRIHGRVYIIFGTPKRREPSRWIYDPVPAWGIPVKFTIFFKPLAEGYGLDPNETPESVVRIIRTFAEKMLLNPDLNELPTYGPPPAFDASSSEGQIINGFAENETEHQDFAFSCHPYYKKIIGGKTYVILVYDLGRECQMDAATLFGRFNYGEGKKEDYKKTAPIKEVNGGKKVTHAVHIKPEAYTAYFGIRNPENAQYGICKQELNVPDYWNDQLALSSIILTNSVKKKARLSDGEFIFGDQQAFPKADLVFNKADTLYIFYEIYNAQRDGNKLSLLETIQLESEARSFQIPERSYEEEVKSNQAIFLWSSIPVSYLPAGTYKITITVYDKLSGQKTQNAINFSVEE